MNGGDKAADPRSSGRAGGRSRKQRSEAQRFVLFLVILVVAVTIAAVLGYWVPRGLHRILEFRGA